jgi:hypothetical protein
MALPMAWTIERLLTLGLRSAVGFQSGRMIRFHQLHRATGADLKCQAVARVHPRLVYGVIRTDL